MKIHLNVGEFSPYYFIRHESGDGNLIDLPEETVARWEDAIETFKCVQNEMQDFYNRALSSIQYIEQPYDVPKS